VIGSLQKNLPVHIVNEYCRPDRAFHPCPTEWESKLLRTRNIQWWDPTPNKYTQAHWCQLPTRSDEFLGVNIGYARSNWNEVGIVIGDRDVQHATYDMTALQSLLKTRLEQLEKLKLELSKKKVG